MNKNNLLSDDKRYMMLAIEQARKSVEQGGFPAGAIVVKDGQVVAEGISLGFKLNDPTSHAETASIREASKKLQTASDADPFRKNILKLLPAKF